VFSTKTNPVKPIDKQDWRLMIFKYVILGAGFHWALFAL
jgi:hypothetical protein